MRTRLAGSIALTVVGALLLLVGGLALYAREEIVDQDAFAQRAGDTLQKDAVRHAVARELAASVSEAGPPQLVSARPILESVFEALIDTEPFQRVFDNAARQANRLLFTREKTVVLKLEDAVTVMRSALEGANPKLAKKIPQDIQPELAKLENRSFATKTVEFADNVRLLGIVLPLLSLVAFAGAVLVAPDRRNAITRSGLAVGAVGIFAVVALTVLRNLVVGGLEGDVLDQEEVRAAGEAIWDGFFGDLRAWAIAVGAAGLIVAAASASLLRPVEVSDRAEHLGQRLIATPKTTGGRVARGVGAVLLGIFVVLNPTLAIQLIAIAAGALLLLFGTSELLDLIQEPERDRLRRPGRRGIAIAGAASVCVVLAGVILIAAIGGRGHRAGAIDPDSITACNGSPKLCDKRLNEVTFPGTHNSMSAADDRGWLFTNQRHDIAAQLDDGIRLLLIDPHYGVAEGNKVRTDLQREGTKRNRIAKQIGEQGLAAAERLFADFGRGDLNHDDEELYLCHSLCELGATRMVDALDDVRKFLEQNRYEVVIIFIEPSADADDIADAFHQAGLDPYLATLQRYEPLPTLRELIAADRRLIVFTERGGGTPAWYHEGFSYTQDTEVGADPDECLPRNGNAASPLLLVNNWVDGFPAPVEANEKLNDVHTLLVRARTCRRELGRYPNMLPVDFYDSSGVVEVAANLNGVSIPDSPGD